MQPETWKVWSFNKTQMNENAVLYFISQEIIYLFNALRGFKIADTEKRLKLIRNDCDDPVLGVHHRIVSFSVDH